LLTRTRRSCADSRWGGDVVEPLPILFDTSSKPVLPASAQAHDRAAALGDFLPVERDEATGEVGLRMDLNILCAAAVVRTGVAVEEASVSGDVLDMVRTSLQEIRGHALSIAPPRAPGAAARPQASPPAPAARPVAVAGKHDELFLRLIRAQDHAQQHAQAVNELRAGARRSQWLWWEFPAFSPVRSSTQPEFDLPTCAVARAWLAHPVLGPRWMEISLAAVEQLERGVGAQRLLGCADSVGKFLESMTLAAIVAQDSTQRDLAVKS